MKHWCQKKFIQILLHFCNGHWWSYSQFGFLDCYEECLLEICTYIISIFVVWKKYSLCTDIFLFLVERNVTKLWTYSFLHFPIDINAGIVEEYFPGSQFLINLFKWKVNGLKQTIVSSIVNCKNSYSGYYIINIWYSALISYMFSYWPFEFILTLRNIYKLM